MRQNIQKKNNKGFTLVELIVVLVILAILAAILVPALLGYIDRAKDEKFIFKAESVERAIQTTYSETYAEGYELLQCRANFRDNGTHYNEKMFYYTTTKINYAAQYNKSEGDIYLKIFDRISELSDLGDYQLVYISFAYNHDAHQICGNQQKPGVAGQGEDTQIIIKKKGTSNKVTLKFDDSTGNWYVANKS